MLRFRTLSLFAAILLCHACGGGGSSGNQAPNVEAGTAQTLDEGSELVLNGTASDSDGTIASYQWAQISGPSINLDDVNTHAAALTITVPWVTSDSTIQLRLTVADNAGNSANDTVTITVRDRHFVVFRADKDQDGRNELYRTDFNGTS